jgi:hypothetical protein
MTTSEVARWFRSGDEPTSVPFSCVLGEQPGHAVPRRLLERLPVAGTGAALADSLAIGEAADMLGEEEIAPGSVAVVDDPLRGSLPYWLDPASAAILAALRDGRTDVGELPVGWAELLSAAGLVRGDSSAQAEQARADAVIATASARLAADGYAPIPGVLHPFHLGELRLHVRRLARLGRMRDGDGQTPLRWVRYDDAALRVFHREFAGLVSAVAGEPVKPSYVYTAVYHDGAELPKHTDRPQCWYTMSVSVDCLPDPYHEVPWPLELDAPSGQVSAYQALGDGLVFTGMEIPHARPPLPTGLTVASAFFHYVPEAFDGPLG